MMSANKVFDAKLDYKKAFDTQFVNKGHGVTVTPKASRLLLPRSPQPRSRTEIRRAGALPRYGLKSFASGVTALDRVSFAVARGEFLSLVGPSGCGKSTALRLIAGLTAPSSGAVTWTGATAFRTGFVFQDAALLPWATVARNVALPLELKGETGSISDRVGAALETVGLLGLCQRFPAGTVGRHAHAGVDCPRACGGCGAAPHG
jgi:ABC-type glutathione transport system ATPase component